VTDSLSHQGKEQHFPNNPAFVGHRSITDVNTGHVYLFAGQNKGKKAIGDIQQMKLIINNSAEEAEEDMSKGGKALLSSTPLNTIAQLHTPRRDHALIQLGHDIYATGGRDTNGKILNSCEKLNLLSLKVSTISPLHSKCSSMRLC
jgi:hypothetical protein